MSMIELQAILPIIVLTVVIVLLMLVIAFRRAHGLTAGFTVAGLLCTLLSIPVAMAVGEQTMSLLSVDRYGIFFTVLLLGVALASTLLSWEYLRHRSGRNEEFYLLLLLATLGALVLAFANHVVSLLLGMELLGVSLYAMISYPEKGKLPLEAAIKYLVLSGCASAVLLFGFALLYAALGSMSFVEMGGRLSAAADNQVLILAGTALVLAGVGFKLSVVPFHMWTPDVYQGAPLPVAGFLATASKGAIFAVLLRFFMEAQLHQYNTLLVTLGILAVASMLVGNLLALQQQNIKRLLAYSSIAHFGYLLITLVAGGVLGGSNFAVEAASYYVVAYVVTTLAAFAVLSVLSSDGEDEKQWVADLTGLFWRRPLLAGLMTLALLSLAGIPLTAGFIGKFYVFVSGVEGALWILLGALVLGSAVGIYYYLRVIYVMTLPEENKATEYAIPWLGETVAVLLAVLVVWLGVFPQPLMAYIGEFF
ncbi:MAG: NADH-quinone oxidoreductase subunit N [Porticoccaceae bacterium]|nr:MAG: NADH-quinone oxidoreductase subunit N [Porticoccaceae bacterium]